MKVRLAGDAYDVARAAALAFKAAGPIPVQFVHVIEPLLAAVPKDVPPKGRSWWLELLPEHVAELYGLLEVAKTHPTANNMGRRALARMQSYLATLQDPHDAPATADPGALLRQSAESVLDTLRRGDDQHVEMACGEKENDRLAALCWMRGRWICRLLFCGGQLAPDDGSAELHGQGEPLVQFYDVRPPGASPLLGAGPLALVASRRVSDVLDWTTTRRLNAWAPQYVLELEALVEFQNRIRHALAAPAQLPRRTVEWLGIRPKGPPAQVQRHVQEGRPAAG